MGGEARCRSVGDRPSGRPVKEVDAEDRAGRKVIVVKDGVLRGKNGRSTRADDRVVRGEDNCSSSLRTAQVCESAKRLKVQEGGRTHGKSRFAICVDVRPSDLMRPRDGRLVGRRGASAALHK